GCSLKLASSLWQSDDPDKGQCRSAAIPPFEDSGVLVLSSRSTSPDSSPVGSAVLYLDLRLFLPAMNTTGIDWAFAGLRQTEEQESAVQHRYTIDSHWSGEPPDEQTMMTRIDENGEEVVVETGVALDPETGKVAPYEEVWKEQNISSGISFAFLVSTTNADLSTRFVAVIGPHAMGLSQGDPEDDFLTCGQRGQGGFHAVRLRADNPERLGMERRPPNYETVFSTGHAILEVIALAEREGERGGEGVVLIRGQAVVQLNIFRR
ncbi:hypothetical protein PAXRUDRAFT_766324, partial [Paxillus rubicundulus Ve08.2h10]